MGEGRERVTARPYRIKGISYKVFITSFHQLTNDFHHCPNSGPGFFLDLHKGKFITGSPKPSEISRGEIFYSKLVCYSFKTIVCLETKVSLN